MIRALVPPLYMLLSFRSFFNLTNFEDVYALLAFHADGNIFTVCLSEALI